MNPRWSRNIFKALNFSSKCLQMDVALHHFRKYQPCDYHITKLPMLDPVINDIKSPVVISI